MSLTEISSGWEQHDFFVLDTKEQLRDKIHRLQNDQVRLQWRIRELETALFDRLQLIKKLLLEKEAK